MKISYLRPRDPLILLGPDDLGQLRGHVELHLHNDQELWLGLAGHVAN